MVEFCFAGKMATGPSLHIVFGFSAAGSLKHALGMAGRNDDVLFPHDDFSFGPIAAGDAGHRAQWVDDVLGVSDWQGAVDETARFLAMTRRDHRPVIAWVSFREARSYAGFLWWLAHWEDRPWSLADVADLSRRQPEDMLELFDREQSPPLDQRERWRDRWKILQHENAPFRVIVGDDLVSAPLTQFDATLLALATREWQRMAKIVGMALVELSETGFYQTSDLVLAARLEDLAHAGALEWRGELSLMRGCELRLPA